MGEIVVGNGEAYGKGINSGGDALNEQCFQCQTVAAWTIAAFFAFVDHIAADPTKEDQGNPGDHRLKHLEISHQIMNTEPTDQGGEWASQKDSS